MIRRLASALSMLALVACGDPKPEVKAEPEPPPPPVAVTPDGYRPAKSETLDAVRARGTLRCGVHTSLPGFALRDARGEWRGFDVDICRAVATAALGDAAKVQFVVVDPKDRFAALQKGEVDVLSRNTSRTFARDAGLGLTFPVVTYYDGQGFLVRRALALNSAEELGGARVCIQDGAAAEANVGDYFRVRGMTFRAVMARTEEEARKFYEAETCDVYTADVSALAASRSVMANPGAHVILPTVISKEPLGPVVRDSDPTWADIVAWTVYATLLAEELGITSRTVEQARETATDPETRRLLGVDGDLGALLGLKPDWAFQVVRQVGAYHEIFRRDLGADSALRLDRGLNALWSAPAPGLMYAPPMR
ncbi:amino acid ABC transporter substrate-binding protein [Phenylobacterium sp. SCN 70-31]|uniref:amino acid ABC transporter substrate-binding protein n=1 Tax=Phenylobacterium sp. SCN 70-31 TaxID=1660129 RepID=UPI00086882D9|nr:amino acid ABC transporter substrate-binding protein [Phenylobacterium sp. SCN 70-31]ODT88088.1 MAG: amino acid ABC transporter substrate-binding protein [Phenylobacterium sp. SCN 70-31]